MPRSAIQKSALEDLLALRNAVLDSRPGRNAHTVLRVIRRNFAGYLWYVKGDLSTILDGMKVGMAISALMRDVRDRKVIDLIKDALVTPSFFGFAPEEAEKLPSWGHLGVLSPILSNICLNELDLWTENKIKEFYRPSKSDVIWNSPKGGEEQGNTSWPEFVPTSGPDKTRKMDYIRYGGHIVIGIRGLRADAATLRKQLIEFCDQKYLLKLDNESLPIEHITEASLKQCIKQFRKLQFLKGDRDPDPQPCFRMFHATQAYTNAQMNKFLATMVEWYRYADNRKKVVNFCSYIIRGSLAKLYAAKYKLRSRAKVYKIASRNLSRPLKEKKGQSPEYHNLLRMGLVDSIDRLEDPKTLEEQRSCLQELGLVTPQDYISMLVWNYKRNAMLVDHPPMLDADNNNVQQAPLGLSQEEFNGRNRDEEDSVEGFHAARI
ncbi:Nuclear intron maturase 2 protein [Thalictrum thalictroides]|uniref:Nuclear intron maturase 2 protein n=1 Tax=Thalictrum thalictroides TaxID=46969 RepID=A0A7J6W145_THATH|nr:Nuclear intron maturase 2 protein [Thalictrum thalictroides]